MIDYAQILTSKFSDRQWSLNANDYEQLTMLDGITKPTQATLDGLWAEVQQEIADAQTAKQVARQAVLDKLGLTADEAAALFG